MSGGRDFEAELFAACVAERSPGKTLKERGRAQASIERILADADAVGVDLYGRFFEVDERARLSLLGGSS